MGEFSPIEMFLTSGNIPKFTQLLGNFFHRKSYVFKFGQHFGRFFHKKASGHPALTK
jgi:hypothetical protein